MLQINESLLANEQSSYKINTLFVFLKNCRNLLIEVMYCTEAPL